jgi:ABC-type Na+ efflux pump permease subunit
MIEKAVIIAALDIRYQMRQGATLLWVFVMPPIFFYFLGTATGGFNTGVGGGAATPLAVHAAAPGFMREQFDLRLRENGFAPGWQTSASSTADSEADDSKRTLTLPDNLSEKLLAGEQLKATFDTGASSLTRDYEAIRIQRSLYTVLADIAVTGAQADEGLSAEALRALNAEERIWQLEVEPAGNRLQVPNGFEQAIPGILVMFTLLVLLTSGAAMLAIERRRGLLRRLAAAPISRGELVAGKWAGRMALAVVQVGVALIVGTVLFRMHWGPNPGMVVAILLSWAAFCASSGLLLGSLARSEGQAVGMGVLLATLLAALGGCWWPIEITPDWMQFVHKLVPTGWTMDALHKLVSFEAGALSALPHLAALVLGALVVTLLAVNRFRYE